MKEHDVYEEERIREKARLDEQESRKKEEKEESKIPSNQETLRKLFLVLSPIGIAAYFIYDLYQRFGRT